MLPVRSHSLQTAPEPDPKSAHAEGRSPRTCDGRNARLQQRWILGWELGRARSRLSMDAFRGLDWHDRAPAETVIRQSMIVGAKASAKVGS